MELVTLNRISRESRYPLYKYWLIRCYFLFHINLVWLKGKLLRFQRVPHLLALLRRLRARAAVVVLQVDYLRFPQGIVLSEEIKLLGDVLRPSLATRQIRFMLLFVLDEHLVVLVD